MDTNQKDSDACWGISQEAATAVSNYFDWVAQHEQINQGIHFTTQHFVGADGIHETDNINLYKETFMFQSHIQGDWNDNVWNEKLSSFSKSLGLFIITI